MIVNVSRRALVSGLLALPFLERPAALAAECDAFGLSAAPRQGAVLLGMAPDRTMALTLNGRPVDFAVDGRFLIAFDRDAGPEAVLRAELSDDSHVEDVLVVAPGNWQIERVDAPLLGEARTSEEFKARRAVELEQIAAARAIHVDSDGWRQPFVWPVKARVSGRFGAQRIYQGTPASYHGGVDLAAAAGTTYVAPADGVVALAADQPFTLEGNLLIVDHGMGLNSAFLHAETLLVKRGDVVQRGQPLGLVGMTGRATGPHLHWSMKWQDARIHPLTMIAAGLGA